MSKDQSGAELKAGDRVTISGVVAHAGESDAAPCQVLLDVAAGDAGPLVTLESRLLKAAGQSAEKSPPAPPATVPSAAEPAKTVADASAAANKS
jgi:hypothetical protein